MKILFLVYHGFSDESGISKKIHYQVKGLRQNGHEVHLCYYDFDSRGHRCRYVNDKVIADYGLGAMAYYILLLKTQDTKKVFILSFLMGGLLEFICSYLQEIIFGSVSWDYSGTFLNINGRTNFQYCIYWGIIGIVFLKIFWRFTPNLDNIINSKKRRYQNR